MSYPLANIEPVARAICARELGARNEADEIPALVDRYWPVTAALLEAGLIDEAETQTPHDVVHGQAAWEDWLSRHKYRIDSR